MLQPSSTKVNTAEHQSIWHVLLSLYVLCLYWHIYTSEVFTIFYLLAHDKISKSMINPNSWLLAMFQVLESWSNRFETLNQDTELNQVRVCAKIGVECRDFNPAKRPVTQYIIETLYEMEQTYGFIETDLCTSSATHVS